jgi:uncharacterized protein YgiM (DUF1202 family)
VTSFDKVIPPGSEGKVHARVDISHASGILQKSITVDTNDPEKSRTVLNVRASVKQYVTSTMDIVRFQGEKGQDFSQELTLTTAYEKPITLSNARVDAKDPDDFMVELTPVDKGPEDGQKSYKLKVTLRADAAVGDHRGTIRIDAAGSPQDIVEIPIYAHILGPITAQPPVVTFHSRTFPDTVVTTENVNIRELPNTSSNIIMKTEKGRVLEVTMQNAEWYQVVATEDRQSKTTTRRNMGWINKKYVRADKQEAPPVSQTVSLIDKKGTFKVLEYKISFPELTLDLHPATGNGRQYELTVSVAPGKELPKNVPPGKITIRTDSPDEPELTIPVYIMVS